MKELKNKIAKSLENKIPFVLYRIPNSTKVKFLFQEDSSTHYSSDFSENGFVFSPFSNINKSLVIPLKNSLRGEFDIDLSKYEFKSNSLESELEKNKQDHINLVQKGIDSIRNGEAEKIVLSRKRIVSIEDLRPFEIFKKLMFQNINACVYLWFHPVSGIWMGATPETFLNVKGKRFKTMALASTRSYKGNLNVNWNDKEKQEHKFVIDYIESNLKKLKLKIGKPTTIRAGNLVHLCSNVEGVLAYENQLNSLIKTLHPTPAVCGISKESANQFILKNENYDREFYTGFLGEIDKNCGVKLFVNLRCMKIENSRVHIFVGGGITKDSDPEKEWEETVLKSEVMHNVL